MRRNAICVRVLRSVNSELDTAPDKGAMRLLCHKVATAAYRRSSAAYHLMERKVSRPFPARAIPQKCETTLASLSSALLTQTSTRVLSRALRPHCPSLERLGNAERRPVRSIHNGGAGNRTPVQTYYPCLHLRFMSGDRPAAVTTSPFHRVAGGLCWSPAVQRDSCMTSSDVGVCIRLSASTGHTVPNRS